MSQDVRQQASVREQADSFRPRPDDIQQIQPVPIEVRHVSNEMERRISMSPLRDETAGRLEESRREVEAGRLELEASRAEIILMGADMTFMKNELQSAQIQLTERLADNLPDTDNLFMYSEDRGHRP